MLNNNSSIKLLTEQPLNNDLKKRGRKSKCGKIIENITIN